MSAIFSSGSTDNLSPLELFELLARTTWDWLGYARDLGLGVSEDSITDITSLKIAHTQSKDIHVTKVSKRKEQFVGFDWMWVIRRPGQSLAVYAVQAKKLKLDSPDYSYGKLKYKTSQGYQLKALRDFANRIRAIPLYCFFNNVPADIARSKWHCLEQQADVSQMGCTLVPLDWVNNVHDKPWLRNSFETIHRDLNAVPWRCLFHRHCMYFNAYRIPTQSRRFGDKNDRERHQLENMLFANQESIAPDDVSATRITSVDFDDFVSQLHLERFVEQYASDKFTPVPEWIFAINLRD